MYALLIDVYAATIIHCDICTVQSQFECEFQSLLHAQYGISNQCNNDYTDHILDIHTGTQEPLMICLWCC